MTDLRQEIDSLVYEVAVWAYDQHRKGQLLTVPESALRIKDVIAKHDRELVEQMLDEITPFGHKGEVACGLWCPLESRHRDIDTIKDRIKAKYLKGE